MKRTIAMILALMLAMSAALMTTAFAAEEKKYCNATLEDEFADDCVLVMLSNEESMKLKEYTAEDFSEIGAVSVEDLSIYMIEKIREQQAAISSPDEWIDTSEFNRILAIYLDTKSKQNVLDVIHELEKRDDILIAQPNYRYELLDGTTNEEKIYCDATLEDDFEDDNIIVAFTNEASMKLKEYTVDDFSEIEAESVEDLTKDEIAKIKAQQEAILNGEKIEEDELIDTDSFCQIINIVLVNKGKQNVLDAVHEIEKRDDVLFAEPNFLYITEPIVYEGDVNGDGILDISDATYMQMYLAGYKNCFIDESDEIEFENADYNGDGIIDINDVTAIQMELAGYNV